MSHQNFAKWSKNRPKKIWKLFWRWFLDLLLLRIGKRLPGFVQQIQMWWDTIWSMSHPPKGNKYFFVKFFLQEKKKEVCRGRLAQRKGVHFSIQLSELHSADGNSCVHVAWKKAQSQISNYSTSAIYWKVKEQIYILSYEWKGLMFPK